MPRPTPSSRPKGAKHESETLPALLADTAKRIDEAAFLKSFERFTNRLGDPPQYKFLVTKEQVAFYVGLCFAFLATPAPAAPQPEPKAAKPAEDDADFTSIIDNLGD